MPQKTIPSAELLARASSLSDPVAALRLLEGHGTVDAQAFLFQRPSVLAGWADWGGSRRRAVAQQYLDAPVRA